MTPIKVLVMEATQYQALVGNDWLSKVNAMLDWNTQELQLTYQSQHIRVLAMCGHFKTPQREILLIKLEKKKEKPTWEAYQVFDWVRKGTPIEAVWRRAVQQLDSCPHDDDKIWQMALAKIKGVSPEEIKTIKDNLPEPLELDWDVEPIINLLDSEQFYEHYQELASTREEQEQRSSSIQYGNNNDTDFNSDSNSNLNYEQYIALPDLFKEQELK
ncbi:hypothetical protein G9A89_014446 [Geosiphon pyriformis]|nr:hypothetical protein G9A89_014446 [Geosiphon pyriformis]